MDQPRTIERRNERTSGRTNALQDERTNDQPHSINERTNERTNDHTPATTTTLQQQRTNENNKHNVRQQQTHRTSVSTNEQTSDRRSCCYVGDAYIHLFIVRPQCSVHEMYSVRCNGTDGGREQPCTQCTLSSNVHSVHGTHKVAVYRGRRTNVVVRLSLSWRFEISHLVVLKVDAIIDNGCRTFN